MVESATHLPETLRRLDALAEEQGLPRSALLDPRELAARTALPERTVRTLLKGGTAPPDKVNDRVCARIRTLADAHLARTGCRMSDLAADIRERLGVSDYWARQVCAGRKVPSVEFLHGLVEFFGVEGGEAFFTAPAADALDRVLVAVLREFEQPAEQRDPILALMDRYGLKAADLRRHGAMTAEQLDRLLEGVIRSAVPQRTGEGGGVR